MSSAVKIERIVDKVRSLAEKRFDACDMPPDWFRRVSRRREDDGLDEPDYEGLPFFPFSVLLVTGTAGAGKTCSIQTLAANLDCVVTGTTGIASQNLSTVLNRTRSAQIKTIYRAFGFNSRHVPMVDGFQARSYGTYHRERRSPPVREQQISDLSTYWPVIADITSRCLDAASSKRKSEPPDLCESSVIIIDECGVLLRYMLHVVVFFYYFYNALHETRLYRERRVPCIVCVGSPTQTEALETSYSISGGGYRNVRKGMDVLSALITDPVLNEYCDTFSNWIMFINNKRCTDLDFSDLLKHVEFGLPLTGDHVSYVDRFVRPTNLIRDPSYMTDATRLFLSHVEVKSYVKRLHDQLRIRDRQRLFELPVYCLINNRVYEEYCELSEAFELSGKPEVWFSKNLPRIVNYSQFADHNVSDAFEIERLGEVPDDETEASCKETLITTQVTYIRESSVGVNSKMKSCVVGFSGTFDDFAQILQNDTFIDRTPCEQAVYAYALVSGLLYSSMYLFYSSPMATADVLRQLSEVALPDLPVLCPSTGPPGAPGDATAHQRDATAPGAFPAFSPDELPTNEIASGDGSERPDTHDIPCLREFGRFASSSHGGSAASEDMISDFEMLSSSDAYADRFYLKYANPPTVAGNSFESIVCIYTAFREIFMERYKILQNHTKGRFGHTKMVTYNGRNVTRKHNCQIVSHTKTFTGMLSYASPVNGYVLEGYTTDVVLSMMCESKRIHPKIAEKGVPRLVVRDPLGFLCILDLNMSKFIDTVGGRGLHICTVVDYGISSRTAMTIAKSQGLSLEKVAIDFGDTPVNLRLSQIYVAMSRVVNPDKLVMNLNPMRLDYHRNTFITPHMCKALKNDATTLVF